MEIACPFGRLGHPARPKCAAFGRMTFDDGQPDLPSGHAELPGGGQRDYLV